MNAAAKKQLITGLIGNIELAIDAPEHAPIGVALVAHPHPLYGGTMDNKVAQTLARVMVELGYVAVRPNFRGVGQTAGEHDHGVAETQDMLHVIDWMRTQWPADLPLVLAGFSFGSFVQSHVAAALALRNQPVKRMIMVGTAAGKWDVAAVPSDTIVIHGELDDTIPLHDVLRWAEPLKLQFTVDAGPDKLFHRRLILLKNIIHQQW
jgi:alpha/beta superfamily hydrolase